MHKEILVNNIMKIKENIEFYGMERFDPSDIKFKPIFQKDGIFYTLLRRIVAVFDIFLPRLTKKAFNIPKEKYITAYTHLGIGMIKLLKSNYNIYSDEDVFKIKSELYSLFVEKNDMDLWWNYSIHITDCKVANSQKRPTMHMHGLARANIFLIRLYRYSEKRELLEDAILCAKTTLKHHQVYYYPTKEAYISYYYNTDDCTLNVNTEFAQWISMIPRSNRTSQMEDLLIGIINLIVNEQNEDGSWNYTGRINGQKVKKIIDCHHTGTVLYNLINIVGEDVSDTLDKCLIDKLINACSKGMEFYINEFFNAENGRAVEIYGKKYWAGPVQYSEAIYAFCAFVQSPKINQPLKDRIKNLLPKVMLQCVSLVNYKDGSAPSYRRLGKWQRINSIRWGNGAIMQAIAYYLKLDEEGILDVK